MSKSVTALSPAFSASGSNSAANYKIVPYNQQPDVAKERLNALIERVDSANLESVKGFGEEVFASMQATSQQLVNVMQNEADGVFGGSLKSMMDEIKGLDIEGTRQKLAGLIGSGAKMASRNKTATAIVLGGLVTGQLWASAGAAGFTGIKEFIREKRKDPNSMEEIEERVRSSVVAISGHLKKLELASHHIPVIEERIHSIAEENANVYRDSTDYLVAGREVLRRLQEEEIAGLQAQMQQEPSFELQQEIEAKIDIAANMEHRLKILEKSRIDAVVTTNTLRELKTAIRDNRFSLESLQTTEMAGWLRDMALAGVALDTHRNTKLTSEMRDKIEGVRDDAATSALHALEAASSGRIDSPERLQQQLDRLTDLRESLAEMDEKSRAQEEKSKTLRLQLEESVAQTMADIKAHVEGDKPQLAAPIRPARTWLNAPDNKKG